MYLVLEEISYFQYFPLRSLTLIRYLTFRNVCSYQLHVASCLFAEVDGLSHLVEMDEITGIVDVHEMTETDTSKICEVTGSIEFDGRVNDVAEVIDATNVTEMIKLAEKEDEGSRKKGFCQKIISACIPRVKTFCLGKTTPINVVKI